MKWARLPSGKIKYYWVGRDPEWISTDRINGIHGVRKWLLDIIPDGESILDIGCGPGHVSEIFRLAGRKNDYLGIDNDDKGLELAKSLFPEAKFDCQDANFLPYPNGSFDNCILFTVVESMADFRRAVEEAVRVARKRVIITTFVPLTEAQDKNTHIVNNLADYIVNINKKRFLDHITSLGSVTSGVLSKNGKDYYWWFIIDKTGKERN